MENILTKDATTDTAEDLIRELDRTRGSLALAYDKFNFVSDPEMVESCIYEINALKAKCNYLIRKIKECSPECVAAGVLRGGRACQL
ncbi:MAG: DUF2508 family protein [Clostridiales bacterium]|nr:DUF2508 family protein [Clostridiales bacterium]